MESKSEINSIKSVRTWMIKMTRDAALLDGWMDGRMDGWTDGWMDGWMDGWTDGCPFSTAGTSNVRGNSAVNHSWRLRRPMSASYMQQPHREITHSTYLFSFTFFFFFSLVYCQSNQVTLFPQVRFSAVSGEMFGWVTVPLPSWGLTGKNYNQDLYSWREKCALSHPPDLRS